MNTVANIFLATPVTADDVIQFKTDAASEYGNAKSSAMKSAANAYLVGYHCESEYAQPALRGWLDGEIEKLNAEITAHNKAVDHEKDRAKLCAEGKLNEELTEDEKVELLKKHSRKAADWNKEKQVKIEGRDDPPPLNWSTLKYVFCRQEDRDAEEAP